MDDNTFQQELLRLKHRVSQMASTYQRPPALSQPLARSDAFHNQLHDLKARLESMQTSLSLLTGTPTEANLSQPFQTAEPYSMPSSANQIMPGPHGHLTLPSGPLFWQLFTALRTDVRSLGSRMSDLEQNVSNLEDRVDRLEPTQFTPAASEDATLLIPQDSYPQPGLQQFGEDWAFSSPTAPDCGSWSPQTNQWANQSDQHTAASLAAQGSGMFSYDLNINPFNSAPASESVAFRDREIAQLDELMRKAQESIQHSDAVIQEKDVQIQQLRSERNRFDARIDDLQQAISERDSTIRAYGSMMSDKHSQAEHLQAECQSKDAALQAWSSKHYSMQQAYLGKKTQLCHADRQIQQLQRALYDLQDSRNDEIDELMSSKDDEIKKLREFCEAKDAVTYQQEQIIARGATLLEDRDAELARVGQQMKALDDDYRNETRERARFARLLDERDDEIGQLKSSLPNTLTPKRHEKKQDSAKPLPKAPSAEGRKVLYPPLSPFATAGNPGRRSASWTPKAIDNYVPLPHEQRRASVWRTGQPTAEQHRFGVPGTFTPSSPSPATHASNEQTRDLRRSDSVKLLQRLALAEEGASDSARFNTGSLNATNRSRLPLDDVASRPPLPARVSPRKMTSVDELGSRPRHAGETNHQRPISRHQSIQELPRHRLQAYVEDGASGDA